MEGVYNHKCFTWPASKVSQAREGGRPWQWQGRRGGEQQEGARSDGGRTCRGGRSQRSEMTCFTYCSFGVCALNLCIVLSPVRYLSHCSLSFSDPYWQSLPHRQGSPFKSNSISLQRDFCPSFIHRVHQAVSKSSNGSAEQNKL